MRFRGSFGEVAWTTYPMETGDPEPGVVYVDTFIFANYGEGNDNGVTWSGNYLSVEIFRYEFDRWDNPTLLSYTVGHAVDPDASFVVDRKLVSATGAASVGVSVCT